MLERPRKAYLLFGGVEPWTDGLDIDSRAALASAELVVAITPFASDRLRELAHVMLPIGTFAETSGTYVNLEGLWQSQSGAAAPVGESRPGWKVLRVLANLCGLSDSEYQSSEEVRDELRTACAPLPAPPTYPTYSGHHRVELTSSRAEVLDLSMYQTDAVVRRAPSLQKTQEGRRLAVPY
jgi:NADH-quinone oxidoreductase subunit G